MKKINISRVLFNYLTNVCRSNKIEVGGSLDIQTIGNVIHVKGVKFYDDDDYELRTKKEQRLRQSNFLVNINTSIVNSQDSYCSFHTHPKLYTESRPSNADKEFTKYYQQIVNRSVEELQQEGYYKFGFEAYYIECIVHCNDISFWYYNAKTDKVEKCGMLVDGIEYHFKQENALESLISGFKRGIQEGRRK